MLDKRVKACSFTAISVGMVFNQTEQFVYHRGKIWEYASVEDEVNHRVQ